MTIKQLSPQTNSIKQGFNKSIIIDNIKISADTYRLILNRPPEGFDSSAGQFIAILCDNLLLRRPFSIANVNKNEFEIIYKLKGEGTKYMSGLKTGQTVNFLGPLGNRFNIDDKKALLVGAGVGVAPMIYLSQILKKSEIDHFMLAGFQTNHDLKALHYNNCRVITEDGSSGYKGLINVYLDSTLESFQPQKIYACGPEIVLKKLVEKAMLNNIEIEIALEKKFACGVGVCRGCVIRVKENSNEINKSICKDGPVFKGETVIW